MEDESECKCIDLPDEPVVLMNHSAEIEVFTKSVKLFRLSKELEVSEVTSPMIDWLKEQGCRF